MTENSAVPGPYLEFFNEIKEKAYRIGREEHRARWGYVDLVLEKERERLHKK